MFCVLTSLKVAATAAATSSTPWACVVASTVRWTPMTDRHIPAVGGRVGRRGEVHSLEATCGALKHALGAMLGEARRRLEAERVHTAEERASADGCLRVIAVQESGHVWPGCRGLGIGLSRFFPGLGAMATSRHFSGPHACRDVGRIMCTRIYIPLASFLHSRARACQDVGRIICTRMYIPGRHLWHSKLTRWVRS